MCSRSRHSRREPEPTCIPESARDVYCNALWWSSVCAFTCALRYTKSCEDEHCQSNPWLPKLSRLRHSMQWGTTYVAFCDDIVRTTGMDPRNPKIPHSDAAREGNAGGILSCLGTTLPCDTPHSNKGLRKFESHRSRQSRMLANQGKLWPLPRIESTVSSTNLWSRAALAKEVTVPCSRSLPPKGASFRSDPMETVRSLCPVGIIA